MRIQILKPHPRKGTETSVNVPSGRESDDFKTTSPQGDGNCRTEYGIPLGRDNFKTTSPQGDGNKTVCGVTTVISFTF